MNAMNLGKTLLIALACATNGASITGCATSSRVKLPQGRIAQSDSAIQAAEEAGAATNNPTAALHLRMAREENETAKRLATSHEDRRAETMLLRSVVDADLAKAIAMETTTQLEAQKARDSLRGVIETPSSGTRPATQLPNREERKLDRSVDDDADSD
jgi:hypothetical protein